MTHTSANAKKWRMACALNRSNYDPNRRDGVGVKKTWQFAEDPDKGKRTIYVTINHDIAGGEICQVMVSGSSADSTEYAKSGSMIQKQFDGAEYFITRAIQHGDCPSKMLDDLVPIKQDPNHVIKEPTTLEVAVLEVIVSEMDLAKKDPE